MPNTGATQLSIVLIKARWKTINAFFSVQFIGSSTSNNYVSFSLVCEPIGPSCRPIVLCSHFRRLNYVAHSFDIHDVLYIVHFCLDFARHSLQSHEHSIWCVCVGVLLVLSFCSVHFLFAPVCRALDQCVIVCTHCVVNWQLSKMCCQTRQFMCHYRRMVIVYSPFSIE